MSGISSNWEGGWGYKKKRQDFFSRGGYRHWAYVRDLGFKKGGEDGVGGI